MPLDRTDRLLLFSLVALNALLKLLWLGVNDLAHDEPFTIYWSQRPLPEFLAMLGTENNPPLYFLLVKGWSLLAPFEAAWLRVPSALASAFTVWPLFLLARRLGNTRMAITAALLFTLSNYHYTYAHEVRAYALFTLLATLGMWLLVRGCDKPDNGIRAMLGLSAVNTLMVYTHFLGWAMIGVQLLVVLLMPGFRHLQRNFLIGMLVTLGWFSPYLRLFLLRAGTSVAQGTWLEPPVAEELYNMVWRWSNAPALALAFLVVIGIAAYRDRLRSTGLVLGLLWAIVPLIGMFAISRWVPIFLDRYLVYAAPGFALLVAASLENLRSLHQTTNAVAAIIAAAMAFTFTPWKAATRQPHNVVVAVENFCEDVCTLHVVPSWYWLNYHAVADIHTLKSDLRAALDGAYSVPIDHTPHPDRDMIVVDASGGLAVVDRGWYGRLGAHFAGVDSVDADHKVRVYRFRH